MFSTRISPIFVIKFAPNISAPAEDEEVFAEDYDDHLDDKASSKPRQPLPKFTNEDLNPDKITYMVSAGQSLGKCLRNSVNGS